MKFQPRRFVVEVKRGTSRAAFTSPDTVTDKFSSAEAMLFGSSRAPGPVPPKSDATGSSTAGGRILKSLVEPVAAVIEDRPEPPRRGRKPGSKNKPKIFASPTGEAEAGAPRATATSAGRRRDFAEDGASWRDHVVPAGPTPEAPAPGDDVEAPPAGGDRGHRIRLRDRSTILKRYVLGTAPRPGQPGSLRARKAARAAR